MSDQDQSRFNNPYISAAEAAELLDVKLSTLYTYVSRGLLQSVPGPDARSKRYDRADVERLRKRHQARAGHTAVAAEALRWGEPVLDTAISRIEDGAFSYRGRDAAKLVADGAGFEQVAELLWTGGLGKRGAAAAWPRGEIARFEEVAALLPDAMTPLEAVAAVLPFVAASDFARFGAPDDAELERGRGLIRRLAALLGLGVWDEGADETPRTQAVAEALAGGARVAEVLAWAGEGDRSDAALDAIDRALSLSADHGLNASTFTARVIASTGADLYACLQGALGALSGPRHGGQCDRVEALIDEVGHPRRARRAIAERLRRGERVPGFGHTLYPLGDPRASLLLEAARRVGGNPRPRVDAVMAVVDAMRDAGHPPPTLDVGLVAVAEAVGLPRGFAVGLFGVGRCAGWIAHVLEQRQSKTLIRPRARYSGAS